MSRHFRPWTIDQTQLLPAAVVDYVPGDHLAQFVVALAREHLDLSEIVASYKSGLGQPPWIPERSATCLREADLNVLSKLGNQGLEWRLEPEAFTRREVRREDDLLDILVGCPIDIQVAWQPST